MTRQKHAFNKNSAKELITSPTTSVVALVPAVKELLGDFFTWEPESIWLELINQGIDVPVENRIKLMAAIAAFLVPSFYWDGVVFEKTALALAGVSPNPEALDEATSAQLAAAVYEVRRLRLLLGEESFEFSHEPKAYAAVVMHREGLVLAPKNLAFAQELLDNLNTSSGLKKETEKAWDALDKKSLHTHAFSESAVDVQLARLAAIELYVDEREARTNADLAKCSV